MERDRRLILPDSAAVEDGSLMLGGCRLDDLAERFGTPLYVYDADTLRSGARRALAAFTPLGARVSFAAKACSTIGVLRIFGEEGLGLDVVSAGELEAGIRAGFSPARVHLHGNCKTDAELESAVRLQIHAVVADNLEELDRLEVLCNRLGSGARVMLRLNLRIEAETHPHLQTSGGRSKFGFAHDAEAEREALRRLAGSRSLRLVGVHAHLGSQLTDPDVYVRAAGELVDMACRLRGQGFAIEEVSTGGGWAVAYRPGDAAISPEAVAARLAEIFRPHRWIRPAVEPGRFLVARAGVALYRIGSVKRTAAGRLVAVDGGMGDNPRPALYGAEYDAFLPLHPHQPPEGPADVVGRYCESGDVLVREVALPEAREGDLLCVPMSGAYQLSMASSYNLVPQPAAVMVCAGLARLIVRRPSIDELLSREVMDERGGEGAS